MFALHIENVRCFTNPPPAPLAPVTVLVGENSTGKSTFLAMLRLVSDILKAPLSFNFNEEPFLLGAFQDVANRTDDGVLAESFSVGIFSRTLSADPRASETGFGETAFFNATFASRKGQPYLAKWQVECAPHGCVLTFSDKTALDKVEVSSPKGRYAVSGPGLARIPLQVTTVFGIRGVVWRRSAIRGSERDFSTEGNPPDDSDLDTIDRLIDAFASFLAIRPYATAPIRTKPRRTYDPLSTSPDPEGTHIPMVLATTLTENTSEARSLERALQEFGAASGLFHSITVKRLGDEEATPFQIRLGFEGQPAFNLADVGYGVSQALPILVDILRSEPGSTLLIQQPEVHLHPRAQAQLGTLLMRLAESQNKRFVVETHSDYLVDRIRMEVRDDEAISPDDAQILYFQREEDGSVQIYPLELDCEGNITNAPPSYRDFFLREEHRFIGV